MAPKFSLQRFRLLIDKDRADVRDTIPISALKLRRSHLPIVRT
jgi:hypothetical protein